MTTREKQMTIPCHLCEEEQACCGIMKFSEKFLERFKDKLQVKFKKIKKDNLIIAITDDARCPFLNRKTRLCEIYDYRPEVCRRFGIDEKEILLACPYFKPDGTRRTLTEKKILSAKIDIQFNQLGMENGK